jgi:2-polyprenyl-6-methoxyphenol hydroxylase-like FAD-dependent oxidoreductase
MNVLAPEPALRGPLLPVDERFDTLAARRSLLESAATRAAEAAGIRIRRGITCRGLHSPRSVRIPCGAGPGSRVPQVTGVETSTGTLPADLVVDCTGRRSQLPSWLRAVGVPDPIEESGRRGFTYYSRYFRSADGALPTDKFPLVVEHGSLGLLRIPADHGTYSLCLIGRSDDQEVRRALRDERAWSAAVRLFPGADVWLDGEPITDGIQIMAGLTDRKRTLYDTEHPSVTGLVAVGDAWAFTTPTVGRGLAMSLQHSLALRDVLRQTGTAHAVDLVTQFARATRDDLGPVYRQTTAYTRHRIAEMDAHTAGIPYRNPEWTRAKALAALARHNADALRAERAAAHLLPDAHDLLHTPALTDAVTRLLPDVEQHAPPGPTRAGLLKTIAP